MQPIRIASVALVIAASVSLARSAPAHADVLVSSVEPARPASGQVVLILTDARPVQASEASSANDRVLIEQDGRTHEAFVFASATSADAIFARLPDQLRPGRAQLIVELPDGVVGEPFAFDIAPSAATPAVFAVYPFAGDIGPSGPIERAHAGERLLLFGTGLDTTGVTVILRHGSGTDEIVPAFANTSTTVGVAPVFDLPTNVPPGLVRLSTRVRVCENLDVCGSTSASMESEPIEFIVD